MPSWSSFVSRRKMVKSEIYVSLCDCLFILAQASKSALPYLQGNNERNMMTRYKICYQATHSGMRPQIIPLHLVTTDQLQDWQTDRFEYSSNSALKSRICPQLFLKHQILWKNKFHLFWNFPVLLRKAFKVFFCIWQCDDVKGRLCETKKT